MAENSASEKTEKASPQKLKKAREKGQVARSKDFVTAVAIMASLYLVVWLMPSYLQDFRQIFSYCLADVSGDGTLDNTWSIVFMAAAVLLVKMLLPLLLVPLAVALSTLVSGGWVLSTQNLVPKFNRLSPLSNLGRMFSGKHLSGIVISILKATAVGIVLWSLCRRAALDYMRLQGMPLGQALDAGVGLVLSGILAMALIFVLFGLIDLPIQVFFFLRDQRMSKQDMKDEHKSNEGSPEVKSRIRQLQRQLSRRSLRKAVPTADVVIVNPKHYAVALKYDEKRAQAPFVVAKGVDEMALYIRELAGEHKIEVVSVPPLARAIYNTSQVQQQIPTPLYTAVALILNYVLQLKAFQNRQRPTEPNLPTNLAIPRQMTEARLP
jgi:flagellar biosynthetic protein FlhB